MKEIINKKRLKPIEPYLDFKITQRTLQEMHLKMGY